MQKKPKIFIVSSVPRTLWAFYKVLLERLQGSEFELTASSSPDEVLDNIGDQIGCDIFSTNITRRISPLRDIVSILRLYRKFMVERYDIVHAHTPKAGFIAMIAGFLARVPSRIFTIHGLPLETATGLKRLILKYTSILTCKLATSVLVVSSSLSKRVAEEGICSLGNMKMLGDGTACGVDLKVFNPEGKNESTIKQVREELGIPFGANVIGFVGRIVPDKGVECLLKSFELVQKQMEDVYLMIIGGFDNVREVVSPEILRAIERNEHITTVGFKKNVIPYYYSMDVLALPSRREGFNYVLIEAAATGLCAVTTKATGCIDGVVDNETGFVVDIDDYEQFANRILRLIQNHEMRDEFGKKGLERVEKLFNSERLVEEHMKLYNDILSGCAK